MDKEARWGPVHGGHKELEVTEYTHTQISPGFQPFLFSLFLCVFMNPPTNQLSTKKQSHNLKVESYFI